MGEPGCSQVGSSTRSWIRRAARLGHLSVGAVYVIVGILALAASIRSHWHADVDRWLDLRRMNRMAGLLKIRVGQLGLVARGVRYGLLGAFLVLAALEHDPMRVRGLGGTFRAVRYERYGRVILATLAAGFVANGLVEIRARYRQITVG